MTNEKLVEILFKNMEKDDSNNIFTNYNNFTRDEHVFEQTVKHCLFLVDTLFSENDRLQRTVHRLLEINSNLKGKD